MKEQDPFRRCKRCHRRYILYIVLASIVWFLLGMVVRSMMYWGMFD